MQLILEFHQMMVYWHKKLSSSNDCFKQYRLILQKNGDIDQDGLQKSKNEWITGLRRVGQTERNNKYCVIWRTT